MRGNAYIEKLIDRLASGEKLSASERILARAYQAEAYKRYGLICVDDALHDPDTAAGLAQKLSVAGINELYITGEWSNQFDEWMTMDGFGLKMRGICRIKNAEYYRDIERWGESDRPADLTALKFSFKEEAT